MKKYFLLTAMAGLALTSCVKNEFEVPQTGGDKVISFAAPVIKPSTRSVTGEITKNYDVAECFNVYAVWHSNIFGGWNTNTSLYMDNVKTKYDDTKNGWRPEVRYYWPKNGYLTFAAYSPSDISAISSYGADGLTLTGFQTGINNTNGYVDVLYSDRSKNKTFASKGTENENEKWDDVDIDFKHALSSIQFTANKKEDYGTDESNTTKISITQIILYGVNSKGTFKENLEETLATEQNEYSEIQKPEWSDHAEVVEKDNPYVYYSGRKLLTSGKWVMNGESGQIDLLLIPQTLPETAAVEITYTIDSPGATTPEIVQTHTVLLNEDEKTPITDKWEPGKRYTYNITIGLDEIYFAPEVSDWEDVTDTPYNI